MHLPGSYNLIPAILLILLGCGNEKTDASWSANFVKAGTNSSPRLTDLTRDGILDVVVGAGQNEGDSTEYGVIALDGRNGRLLWQVGASDQIVGSPVFVDATLDGVPDVFIGGRDANFFGIDGRSGELLWRFQKPRVTTGPLQYARFNFYTPQLIPDQNSDGIPDLLVANGGNVRAPANSRYNRFPGVLMILDSRRGAVLAADRMPDGGETYMSPLICDYNRSGKLSIFFGTGGETVGGSLFRCELGDLITGNLHRAAALKRAEGHGFVTPPVLIDITSDRILDIVGHHHGGSAYAIDGATDSLLWEVQFPNAEANTTPAPGYFNADRTPDFFCHLSIGSWPDNRGTFQVLIDGRSGKILFQDTLGCTGFYSPVTADLDADGFDEALLSINDYNCSRMGVTDIRHRLSIFDFQEGAVRAFAPGSEGKNVSSTPWLGDMDGDGYLDVVYAVQDNTAVLLEFFGMTIVRKNTGIPALAPVTWGAYQGTNYDGVFPADRRMVR